MNCIKRSIRCHWPIVSKHFPCNHNIQSWLKNETQRLKKYTTKTEDNEKSYLIDSKDLTIALLNLLQFPQEIPNQKQQIENTKQIRSLKPETQSKSNKLLHQRSQVIKNESNELKFKTDRSSTYQNLDLARTSLVAQSFMR